MVRVPTSKVTFYHMRRDLYGPLKVAKLHVLHVALEHEP